MTTEDPIRVLVLGGGVGAVTAAFDLTSTYAAQQRFRVTLLQHGWRMGGKGSSGRQGREERVQEHGLHLFMGFYDNAFRVIRQCYGELRPDPDERFQNWTQAFAAQDYVTLGAPGVSDGAQPFYFPKLPGTPGDPRAEMDLAELAMELPRWMVGSFEQAENLSWPARKLLKKAASELLRVMEEMLRVEASFARSVLAGARRGAVDKLLSKCLVPALELLRRRGVASWRVHALELAFAFALGLLRDVLPALSFESINDLDFRDWLRKHGAPEAALQSPLVMGLYDLAFAYEDGDRGKPRVEAGTMAKTFLRMALTYRDAPLYRMNAAMGDTVIGPLYRVLERRGVALKLFHRVQSVTLSADGSTVEKIVVSRQVDLVGGTYTPMKKVRGVHCWPAQPFWDQIVGGQAMSEAGVDLESATCTQEVERFTLERGRHFDVVVMGLSVGAFPTVCKDLIDKHPAWKDMATRLKTVRTQAAQLWLKKTTMQMGFSPELTVQSGGSPPFDSWGDMSHLLPVEQWPAANEPRSIAYLCTVLPEGTNEPARALDEVKHNARAWLDMHGVALWPGARTRGGTFDDDLMVIPDGVRADPLGAQYLRANIDPTERYVQSVPGSSRFRMKADGAGIDNLYLAGDWVHTSVNGGASEAAFEAGAASARAILNRFQPSGLARGSSRPRP